MDDMGLFRTTIVVESWQQPGRKAELTDVLVDTGSEYTWIPRTVLEGIGVVAQRRQRFVVADGRWFERGVGFAIIHAGGTSAPALVAFGEHEDFTLLGAHTLEGLNLRVDPVQRVLVPAGPVITAMSA
jgi:predicted aspartyl protease